MKNTSILIVDDKRSVLSSLELLLSDYFDHIDTLTSPKTLLRQLETHTYDVLLLDMNFTGGINTGNEGLYWLKRVKELNTNLGIVMFTAFADVDLAVKCLKLGADDFVVKPWDNDKIIATLKSVAAMYQNKSSKAEDKKTSKRVEIIGESKPLKQVLNIITKVAKTDANVLLTGENGTGKDLVAQHVHELSPRKSKNFIAVDMGAIAPTLFESELFGHKKGAFTDACDDKIGKFELASGGTLFLDEIGNIPIELQSKLLSVLQNRKLSRVGEGQTIDVDVRLIVATNSNLEQKVMEGTFREDLLYRINTIHIEIPPLRQRDNDILLLAQYFLHKYNTKYDKKLDLSPSAANKLSAHPFPGNVRELQHCMEKAVILCDNQTLQADDFYFRESSLMKEQEETIEDMEKRAISNAIKKYEGNYTAVAKQLGITRQTLYNKIKKHQL